MSISRRDAFQIAAAAGLAALPVNAAGHSERLKITRVELFKVIVPMQPDIISSPELGPDTSDGVPGMPKFIVKSTDRLRRLGVGETYRALDEAAVRRNGASLEGKNIFDMNLTRLGLPSRAGYEGFEMALYDATGKAVGWPVYQLLGGLAQSKVLVNYWCGRKNPADMRRVAERAVKGKFQGIKVKGPARRSDREGRRSHRLGIAGAQGDGGLQRAS